MTDIRNQRRAQGIRACAIAACAAYGLSCLPTVLAQEDFFSSLDVAIDPSGTRSDSPLRVLGWITEKVSYGYETPQAPFSRTDRQLTQMETSLFAQLDWRAGENLNIRVSGKAYHDAIYRFDDDTHYSTSERNEFRNRLEVKDLYLETRLRNGPYLKIGNQILAWGYAEHLRVTDLANPQDQYTFGQQDLEDLRVQVPAALVSMPFGNWSLDAAFTYRAGYDYMAPAGDEFDQFIGLRGTGFLIDRQSPKQEWESFLRASRSSSAGDLQVVLAEFNSNRLGLAGVQEETGGQTVLRFSQQRMRALGVSANRANGSWLMYGELGLHVDAPLLPELDRVFAGPGGWERRNQLLGVVGVEYNGLRNTLLSLELDSVRTHGSTEHLYVDSHELGMGTRLVWNGWNERVQVTSVWNRLSDRDGHVSRLSVDYDWSDNLRLGVLWMDYGAQRDSAYHAYRNNDMLQLNLRFSFQDR